ncbi:TPA: type IV pili twitching motility protein PilT, partial [Legionella pneumophila]|nr:type IV pili twitching motility protein PilT [Legionella pneumophila]
YKEGKITKENAIKYADSKNNVGLQIRLGEEKNFNVQDENLQIQPDDLDKI